MGVANCAFLSWLRKHLQSSQPDLTAPPSRGRLIYLCLLGSELALWLALELME